ncbi:threonine/serine exporter family protein [Brevibacillus ginsengisoli]|uniref:threonine/serine exporter family protein n=1 Tax=Brevibacillus ginsengisoli TaxID=363854 RepID=UPI003CFAE18F
MGWEGLILSLVSAVSYGTLFNVPIRTLWAGGLVAMLGWAIFITMPIFDVKPALSIFIAATFVSLMSQVLSVRLRVPSTNFSISGVIPLVPGATAYRSMFAFVNGDNIGGITLSVQTSLEAGAIASGLILGLSLFSVWKGFVTRYALAKRPKTN